MGKNNYLERGARRNNYHHNQSSKNFDKRGRVKEVFGNEVWKQPKFSLKPGNNSKLSQARV